MANRNNKNNIKDERIEDSTMYGEFIASFDQWMTPDKQRAISEHLQEATAKNKKRDKRPL